MQTAVTFTSEKFRPALPEESQVNPGRYGAELAFWLCIELAQVGIVTSYPSSEDWGWFIEYITFEGDKFWLCCGNVDGTSDLWHCFLVPKRKVFRGSPPTEKARPLLDALHSLLEAEASIRSIEWSEE